MFSWSSDGLDYRCYFWYFIKFYDSVIKNEGGFKFLRFQMSENKIIKKNNGDGAGKGVEILSIGLNWVYFLSYVGITK